VKEDPELLDFIENKSLMGRGLGYVDIHLLASALISNVVLWTFDRRLHDAAAQLGVSYPMRWTLRKSFRNRINRGGQRRPISLAWTL
jgi:hypothetical protein